MNSIHNFTGRQKRTTPAANSVSQCVDPTTGALIDQWTCSCGAETGKNGLARFLHRHPRGCTAHAGVVEERWKVAKELAEGTRAVDDAEGRAVREKGKRNARVSIL